MGVFNPRQTLSRFRVRTTRLRFAVVLPRNDKEGGPASTAGLQPDIAFPHAIPLKSKRNLPVAAGRGRDLT
jgi:hypothetical protein